MSQHDSVSRRSFLQATAATAAAGVFTSSLRADDKEDAGGPDIRVAVIGLNGRGRSHMEGLSKYVVALCDCDEEVLAKRAKEFEKEYDRKVDTYVDYRKLMERGDIDAVSIATPNHTHSLIGIAAMETGKHVYVEKPVSHNVWEGRQLVYAAQKNNRVCQCGTQSRSSSGIRDAVAWTQGGGLGEILYAIGTCYKPRKSIGMIDGSLEIPKSVNYELWTGPADKVELHRPHLHYDWHWDFNTGSGDMGNQGIHQMDIARWFVGHDTLSKRVLSFGGRLGYEDAGNTPNTQVVIHEFDGAPIIFETRGLPCSKEAQKNWGDSMDRFRGSGVGVVVQCENGHVLVPSYSQAIAFDRDGNQVKKFSGSSSHFDNFIDAIRAEDPSLLNAPILDGHLSSGLCHTGNISHRLGEKQTAREIGDAIASHELLANSVDRMLLHLRANDVDVDEPVVVAGVVLEMDPVAERITNNDKADAMLRRTGREPFEIPEIGG